MKKIDLRRELKELNSPSPKEVEIVRVPKFRYLMIDGSGDPNVSPAFAEAVQAMYTAAYTLKFMMKKEKGIDYPVSSLEGLWWADDMNSFLTGRRDRWKWTLMILQPKVVTKSLFFKGLKSAMEKKGLAALGRIRLESMDEGLCVQIMHIGTYAQEGPTIQHLHSFAKERNLELTGKHHEIYLSDPRKAKPEKMKTIIRQPVQRSKK
ncbi:MAG: GyrI-like domain-containing protein [Ignavibacteriales bacterium]|nr:GyrI-like domain-containing protein [Ignavibacteriales bacterium]